MVSTVFTRSLPDRHHNAQTAFGWREPLDEVVKHATNQVRHRFRSYTTVIIKHGCGREADNEGTRRTIIPVVYSRL